jgi:hypothetical protein
MQDRRQIQLFEANAGKVPPSEEGLYLGTSGWSYADWEGTVYSPGTPPAGRLAEYAKYFATVEIDSTFYGTPRHSTVERWREVTPEGFLFAAKVPHRYELKAHLWRVVGQQGAKPCA